ncbi:M23 family metallopeptidase [Streptomyces lichenis]|uniref:Peptidoglycan DD-metalloendopeptidase family protein n=1 Tax=Streptomyces lichenis TaxID=2306967 RepID=A0ABT0IBR9_9ACTN|nr:M23 family metallopeptidase [Streptomyces lichenis]MCK8678770.1 peptidoglycan DD-metalloendopeptidase family protein [Streptomyces lichenis]
MRTTPLRLLAAAAVAAGLLPLTAGAAEAAPPAKPAGYAGSCPAAGTITQGWHSGHDGVDIANNRGTPIYSAGPGTVIVSGPASGYGQWIRIRHDDGTVTEYGHMYERLVSVNQRVSSGQLIARMGSEGQSTGPHLHFEAHSSTSSTRGMDPGPYLSARGVGLPCTPGGGTPGTNFTTWGTSVRVRADARLNAAVVRTLSGPTPVHVDCQKRGDLVEAEGYKNDAWSHIPALGGYVSNIYIDHPDAWLPGVRTC